MAPKPVKRHVYRSDDSDSFDGSHSSDNSGSPSEPSPKASGKTPKLANDTPGKMQAASDSDRLAKQNLKLLETGNFADAQIICNGRTWNVHKVILQSRCVWFEKAFANNWVEAQTGRVRLTMQHSEQIDDLLKFIYSGRYAPELASDAQIFSKPVLETNISLWETADYFLLHDLIIEIRDYLFDQISATLVFFHSYKISLSIQSKTNILKRNPDAFFTDLTRAIRRVSGFSNARTIQKMLAVFVCGLREHLPAPMLRDLMRINQFSADMSNALIALHFTQVTDGAVAKTLKDSHTSSQKTQCSACGKAVKKRGHSLGVVFDPFSSAIQKWCDDCAHASIKSRLKIVVEKMAW